MRVSKQTTKARPEKSGFFFSLNEIRLVVFRLHANIYCMVPILILSWYITNLESCKENIGIVSACGKVKYQTVQVKLKNLF